MGIWNDYLIASATDTARRKQYSGEHAASEEFLMRILTNQDSEARASQEARDSRAEFDEHQANQKRKREREISDEESARLQREIEELDQEEEADRIEDLRDDHDEIVTDVRKAVQQVLLNPADLGQNEASNVVCAQILELRRAEQIVKAEGADSRSRRRDRKECLQTIAQIIRSRKLPRLDKIYPCCYGLIDSFLAVVAARAHLARAMAETKASEEYVGEFVSLYSSEYDYRTPSASGAVSHLHSVFHTRTEQYEEALVEMAKAVDETIALEIVFSNEPKALTLGTSMREFLSLLHPGLDVERMVLAANLVHDGERVKSQLEQLFSGIDQWRERVKLTADAWVANERGIQVQIFEKYRYDLDAVESALDGRPLKFTDWESHEVWPKVVARKNESGYLLPAVAAFLLGCVCVIVGIYRAFHDMEGSAPLIWFGVLGGIALPILIYKRHDSQRDRSRASAHHEGLNSRAHWLSLTESYKRYLTLLAAR